MRLHEILEDCIEFIAVDGVLGSEPSCLYDHLVKSNPSFDLDCFAYIWKLLTANPCIEVILTTTPFKLFGPFERGSDDQTVWNQAGNTDSIEILGKSDGGTNSKKPAILTDNYKDLNKKWRERLRIRCTADEIYFRLTGSHVRHSRITEEPFHILQLIAMSRERGISVVQLNESLGIGSGRHAKVKSLLELGLCVQLDTTANGSLSGLLIHYKFLHLSPKYLSLCRLYPELQDTLPPDMAASLQSQEETVIDPTAEAELTIEQWGLGFSPLTEEDLSSLHVLKERLLKILEHPNLKNHLIKYKGLLYALGWKVLATQKQHRPVRRMVQTLVDEGLLERVVVGDDKTVCIRLTKYNQNYSQPFCLEYNTRTESEASLLDVYLGGSPYQAPPGIRLVQSIEFQLSSIVAMYGESGISSNELWENLNFMYKKALDLMIQRGEKHTSPDHLWSLDIKCVGDNAGRERRLRIFTAPGHCKYMLQIGQTNGVREEPPTSGDFGAIAQDSLYRNLQQYESLVRWRDSPYARKKVKDVEAERIRVDAFKYENKGQTRGRPRKYIRVVNENGEYNRTILGTIPSLPEIPPVLIYHQASGLVVVPPSDYTGYGPPPTVNDEQLSKGKLPSWYDRYPHMKERAKQLRGKEKFDRVEQCEDEMNTKSAKKQRTITGPYREEEEDPFLQEGGTCLFGIPPSTKGNESQQNDLSRPEVYPSKPATVHHNEDINRLSMHVPDGVQIKITVSPQKRSRGRPRKTQNQENPQAVGTDTVPTLLNEYTALNTSLPSPVNQASKTETPSLKRKRGRPSRTDKNVQERMTDAAGLVANRNINSTTDDVDVIDNISHVVSKAKSDIVEDSATVSAQVNQSLGRLISPLDGFSTTHRDQREDQAPPVSIGPNDSTHEIVSPAVDQTISKNGTKDDGSESLRDTPQKDIHNFNNDYSESTAVNSSTKSSSLNVTQHESKIVDEALLPSSIDGISNTPIPFSLTVQGEMIGRGATPLVEVVGTSVIPEEESSSKNRGKGQNTSSINRGRLNIASIRRTHEVVQCIRDYGGIIAASKLSMEHRLWASKYAGTSHPHAPDVPYTMDRRTQIQVIGSLLREGRLQEKKQLHPTYLGRNATIISYHVPELRMEQINAYMRQVGDELDRAAKHDKVPEVVIKLPEAEFTDFDRPIAKTNQRDSDQPLDTVRPYSSRRTALLAERDVVIQLYGYKYSLFVRLQLFHCAIIYALAAASPSSTSSESPHIFSFALLFEELRVKEWYAIMPYTTYSEDLEIWLQEPVNQEMKIKEVPPEYKPPKGFRGALARERIAKFLGMLVSLKIVTPLISTTEEEAEIKTDKGMFRLTDGPLASYYILHNFIPVYYFAAKYPSPLQGVVQVLSEEEAKAYWSAMRDLSFNKSAIGIDKIIESPSKFPLTAIYPNELGIDPVFYKAFRTRQRWSEKPRLVKLQRDAIKSSINWLNATVRLITLEEKKEFAYENALSMSILESELERNRQRAQASIASRTERLRESAIRAKERQERLNRSIQDRLVQEQAAVRKAWEGCVQASASRKGVPYDLGLLDFVSKKTVDNIRKVEIADGLIDYWVGVWAVVKDMGEEERDQRLAQGRISMKQKGKGAAPQLAKKVREKKMEAQQRVVAPEISGATTQRRTRSKRKWTAEDDDLMLDSEAVIRARSRTNGYRGRAAMSQLYPEIGPQTFRLRISKITSEPGKLAYLQRLEEAWSEIWHKHRGTEELPDENIDSSVDFNLKLHVDFLRATIDKRTIRLLAASSFLESAQRAPDLPMEINTLQEEFIIDCATNVDQHTFDSVTDSLAAEDIRINQLARDSFLDLSDENNRNEEMSGIEIGKLHATLKLIIATSPMIYDARCGRRLIETWDESTYEKAIANMVDKGVFKKQLGATSAATTGGRFYDFTPQWQQLSDGHLPIGFFSDAKALMEKVDKARNEGFEWPLIGQAGELDDDVYEFDFKVKRKGPAIALASVSPPLPRKCSQPTVWDPFPSNTDMSIRGQEILSNIFDAIVTMSPEGITKESLCSTCKISSDTLHAALAAFALEPVPRVFWAGYDTARIVSREYWPAWSIMTRPMDSKDNKDSSQLTNPRRWVDIYGELNVQEWIRIVNGVVSYLMARPGVSLKTLRQKLILTLDRLELVEVLQYLLDKGAVIRRWVGQDDRVVPPVEALDMEEEGMVAWWPGVCVMDAADEAWS
nr:hypothetical protein L204_01066 [Cryptococcus depauperatus CBS 7855]